MYAFQDTSLPLEERVQALLEALTLEEKLYLLSTHQYPVPRLGLGEWYIGTEVARGFVSRDPNKISTVFPQPIGLASTFDPLLMEDIGAVAGTEARYYHRQNPTSSLMLWGPTVDLERDPRWGRTEEGYGEDPFLSGEMAAAYTRGLAGDDPVYRRTIPTLKHFCANNNEEERASCSANVTPRTLHEYYYRPFENAIVRGGADAVMTAYNELAGVPACMNPDLDAVAKQQWGMGFAVTDGADFSQNVLTHHSHATHAEALAACLKNGCDIMTDDADMVAAAARDALARGLLTEADLDKAIGAALLGRFRLGEFDGDKCPYNTEPVETDSPAHRTVNVQAAREQMCLLHNTGILPLNLHRAQTVAVIGPMADENYRDWYTGTASYAVSIADAFRDRLGSGSVFYDSSYDLVSIQSRRDGRYWSADNAGNLTVSARRVSDAERFWLQDWGFGHVNLRSCKNNKYVTEDGIYRATSDTPYEWFIKERLQPEAYGEDMRFYSWHDKKMDVAVQPNGTLKAVPHDRVADDRLFHVKQLQNGIRRAAAAARRADVAVVCVGNHPMQVARECYDRPDLELSPHQKTLIRAVRRANPNTILVVVSSYPFALGEEKDTLPAILYTTHAGPELGNAVVDTILGENNPAARCPITWYRSAQDLPSIREYDIIASKRTYLYDKGMPLFPFGHGLSYSRFQYRDLQTELVGEGVMFRFTLENLTSWDGSEVAQIYFQACHPRVPRPNKQLCGFQRVEVPAGATVPVSIFVPWYALEYYDVTQEKMLVEQGTYQFWVGASSVDFRLDALLELPGEVIPPRDLAKGILVKNYDQVAGMDTHLWFSQGKNDWYGTTNDWGGSFIFQGCDFASYTSATLSAAAPCGKAVVSLYAGETLLGSAEIPPSRCADDFGCYTISLAPYQGVADLELRIQGQGSVYQIKLS